MKSIDYQWYEFQISHCDYITDADALMDAAAEDSSIDAGEFVSLTLFVRDLIQEGKLI